MIPSSFWSSTMSNAAWASRAFKASVILKLFQFFWEGVGALWQEQKLKLTMKIRSNNLCTIPKRPYDTPVSCLHNP